MAGEAQHVVGHEGVRRAKRWLDSTTRVNSTWTIYDDSHAVGKLSYSWPHSDYGYSYDLGGLLYGGEFSNQHFLAECKKYADSSDQGTHFDKFLAQSYHTLSVAPHLADHFMWLTWAPFRSNTWSRVSSAEQINKAISKDAANRKRLFGDGVDEDAALELIDEDRVADLESRIWLIVLSDRQEKLVISNEDRALVVHNRVLQGINQ